MITFSNCVSAAMFFIVSYFPGLYGTNGWRLRVDHHQANGPYLIGENYEDVRVKLTLQNSATKARTYPPFELALRSTELRVALLNSSGGNIRCHFEPAAPTRPDTWPLLGPGDVVSTEATLHNFGFRQFFEAGTYRAQVVLTINDAKVVSVPWNIEVVSPLPCDILSSHAIPLDAHESRRPPDNQHRAFIQQIRLSGRVYLVYRSFWGGVKHENRVDRCFRLAELPDVVELKCTGEYGEGKKVTIHYSNKTSPTGTTTLVIDSRGRRTAELDLNMLREHDSIPAPRPVVKP